MSNLDTVIFARLRSIVRGPDAREAERLRERLGTATLLIGLARGAVAQGRLAEAENYLELAERSARALGESGLPPLPRVDVRGA